MRYLRVTVRRCFRYFILSATIHIAIPIVIRGQATRKIQIFTSSYDIPNSLAVSARRKTAQSKMASTQGIPELPISAFLVSILGDISRAKPAITVIFNEGRGADQTIFRNGELPTIRITFYPNWPYSNHTPSFAILALRTHLATICELKCLMQKERRQVDI